MKYVLFALAVIAVAAGCGIITAAENGASPLIGIILILSGAVLLGSGAIVQAIEGRSSKD